jgi:energy-coupling factor transporter ATP-binding protein EcfA2
MRDLNPKDVIILLMGPPGSGKTTFLEIAAGTKVVGRASSEHPNTGISAFRLSVPTFPDSNIVLVNTPAFNDTGKPDIEILRIISGWLNHTYRKGVQISGLIYFHRISDATPVEGTPLRNWRAFEKICGDRFSKVVLATTMWGNADNVDNNVGMKEQELGDFWKVKARGWSMQRFLRNHLSAADVLVPILEHVTKRPLQLQTEISDFHLSLVQTSAARVLFLQLQAHLRRCQKEQKDILHDMANRGIGKPQLQKLEERLRKSYSRSKKIEEGLTKLQEKRAEHGQRFMLRTPGVGTVFRTLGLPKRPELGPIDFEVPTGLESAVLETGNDGNAALVH